MLRYGRLSLFVLSAAALGVAAVAGSAQAPDPEAYQQQSRAFSARMEKTGLAEPVQGRHDERHGRSESVSKSARPACRPNRSARPRPHSSNRLTQGSGRRPSFQSTTRNGGSGPTSTSYFREGISFENMTADQRQAAFAMLEASLSAKGLKLTRDIMRLNETLGELNGNNFVEYGEWKFWISMMGEPSADRAMGLAARRPPSESQLLRHG